MVDPKKRITSWIGCLVIFYSALLCCMLLPSLALAEECTFSWSPNPEPVEGYRLYYKVGGNAGPPFDGSLLTEGPSPIDVGKVTTFLVSGLAENTTYHFALTAYNGHAESGYSTTITVETNTPGPDPPSNPEAGTASYSFLWSPNPEPVSGYRFYYKKGGEAIPPFDGNDAAEGPSAIDVGAQTSFTITGLAENSTYHFAITAYYGSVESDYSQIVSIVADEPPLQAIITSSGLTGAAPYAVDFDASSSTGEITSFSWDFGDGANASGPIVSHQFASAGSYLTTLTITGEGGEEHQASVTITVSASTTPPPDNGPTAVLSSSTAAGNVPFTVHFDGSGSTSVAPPISFSWVFGDGTTGSGALISHIYTTPGSYQASLTVTDSTGLSDQASVPIVVSGQVSEENQAPVAAFTASPSMGVPPLLVSVNAGGSKDPDGWISSYLWNFGDGILADGVTAQHSYSELGNYTITLTVIDNFGRSSSTSRTISLLTSEEYQELLGRRAAMSSILHLLLSEEDSEN